MQIGKNLSFALAGGIWMHFIVRENY